MTHGFVRSTMPTCGENCGTLPSCTPLSVPFVPFQQQGSQRYDTNAALSNGTLFPGLNLPFHLKEDAVPVSNSHLAELQALEFVLEELGLYLDTHAEDQEAFQLFREYAALEREGRARYEAMHGPITRMAAAENDRYTWLNDPWPWEMKGDEK